MIQFPQLRVRTGFSFKKAYGHLDDVTERLQAINAGAAGVVDTGTWAHVKYEEAMKKAGLVPMFGAELPIVTEGSEYKPKAWVLARDTKALYRMTSLSERNGGVSVHELGTEEEATPGLITFTGGVLNAEPYRFDYVDINPASITHAYKAVQYARRFNMPMVITSYNDMPDFKHESDAYAWEVRQSVGPRIISDVDALREHLADVMKGVEFVDAVENTQRIAAELAGVSLKKAPLIELEGDMVAEAREGMRERLALGHIKEWTAEYEERFNSEVEIIKAKAFDSYFLCVADLIRYAKKHMLVGPARGSSAGSLICYLLRITEVDPIKYGLLFYRFIDISRADFPDIDIDFADTKRYMVFDYLKEKYGEQNVSKLGNVNFLKGLSTLEKVRQKFALPFSATDQVKSSLVDYPEGDPRYGHAVEDTIAQTEAGREFARRFEHASRCAGAIEIHPSHSGVHAAGIIVCNEPISHFATVTADGIAQVDKRDAEKLNLLKIDALGLRTLGVIEDANVVTPDELYALEPIDPACFKMLDDDKVGGLFQFEGDAVRSITRQMDINRFEQIDHITSLARPGPMSSGMANTYIRRANGKEAVSYDIPQLKDILEPTHGVIVYQEQIMSIVKDIAGFDWEQTSSIRRAMGKKMGDEYFNKKLEEFVEGCAKTCGVTREAATKIWQQMRTFGSYGFNRSHSVSYGLVTYWTLYMKVYHRLEYAAASLRAAKDDEQVYAILRELAAEGVPYTPMDPDYSETNWMVAAGRLVGGIQNAKGYGAVTALKYIEKRRLGMLTDKDRAKLAKAEVKFSDIAEARTRWGFAYDNPALIGVTSGNPIVQVKDVTGNVDCLIIVKLRKKVLEDENDPARQRKRVEEGKAAKYRGASQFLDMLCVDDSVDSPIKVRIRPEFFASLAKPIAENDPVGSWYLVRAKRFFSVFIVKNILRIDDKEWNK
jgi:DNA-directed DNA polymerase III PolC